MLRLPIGFLFAFLCSAQIMPPRFEVVVPDELKSFFQLSDAQAAEIARLNSDYDALVNDKYQRIAQVQREIAEETARDPLDPMAIGLRYLELEAIRRFMDGEVGRIREKVAALLNERQRAKLKELEDAAKLMNLMGQAQCFGFTQPERPPTGGAYGAPQLARTSWFKLGNGWTGGSCGGGWVSRTDFTQIGGPLP